MPTYIRPLASIRLYYHVTVYTYEFQKIIKENLKTEVEKQLKQKSNQYYWTLHRVDCHEDRIFMLLEIGSEESLAEVVSELKNIISEKLVTEDPGLIHINPKGSLFQTNISVYTAGIPYDIIAPSLQTT